jgi:Meckel syndrome type 1 protein
MAAELRAPRNSIEFESTWRALRGDARLQARYLSLIDPKQLPAVFKDSMTPEVLMAIARAALAAAAAGDGGGEGGEGAGAHELSPAAGVALLAGLTKVPRFPMMAMCLGRAGKEELRALFDAAGGQQAAPLGLVGQLLAVRSSFGL